MKKTWKLKKDQKFIYIPGLFPVKDPLIDVSKNCFSQTYPDFNIMLGVTVDLTTDTSHTLFLLPSDAKFWHCIRGSWVFVNKRMYENMEYFFQQQLQHFPSWPWSSGYYLISAQESHLFFEKD